MSRFRPYPVAAFCAVTLAIWGNRIWLAWTDPDLDFGEKLLWSVPVTVFVVGAVVSLVLMAVRGPLEAGGVGLVPLVLAGFTVAYWGVRLPFILVADHDIPFKVVHGVLALVSIVAATLAWRSLRGVVAATSSNAPVGGEGGSGQPSEARAWKKASRSLTSSGPSS